MNNKQSNNRNRERCVEHCIDSHNSPYHIIIQERGPVEVYGEPPLRRVVIESNKKGESDHYTEKESYDTSKEPTLLCRCGKSKNKPYCDFSHTKEPWNSDLTNLNIPIAEQSTYYEGDRLVLQDAESYCAFARFCEAKGSIWNLITYPNSVAVVDQIKKEVSNCPAGRLRVFDRVEGKAIEDVQKPGIALLEDPKMQCSGPLWVTGAIPIDSQGGVKYELRCKVTLCRCGESRNKPFCDGSHATVRFKDNLK